MILRPAQKIYDKNIFQGRVLRQKIIRPLQAELPCNFGKTELIVNHNIPQTKKAYPNERIIHFCVTMMTDLSTFSDRLSEDGYGKGVYHIKDDEGLDHFLDNFEIFLINFDHIVIFTTLNKMNSSKSQPKFYGLMDKAKQEGFKWTMNRDEGDAAAFDDPEHQGFESGASTEGGASLYATEFIKFFKTYKDTCLYFLALSGSTVYAHKGQAQLVRGVVNPISQQLNDHNVDAHGTVTGKLTSYVSRPTVWKRLETEEEFYKMKELNVEFNSFYLEPKIYHKDDWMQAIKDNLTFLNKKQDKINELKYWLIDNLNHYYPTVNKEQFVNSFDTHQKISLVQSGKDGEYNTKSFIMPTELIPEFEPLKHDYNINPIFVHSDEKINGTIQSISKQSISEDNINMIACCNMMTRGYDIPYISSVVLLSTSPKTDKKSLAAPYTKRHIQTLGRAAREDNGFKYCYGLSGVKKMLSSLGININEDNLFNTKIREYVWENLKVQVFLLEDDRVDTASYISERLGRYYVMETQMKETLENILGVNDDICPLCGKKISDLKNKNIFSKVYSKIRKFFKRPQIDSDFSGIDKEIKSW